MANVCLVLLGIYGGHGWGSEILCIPRIPRVLGLLLRLERCAVLSPVIARPVVLVAAAADTYSSCAQGIRGVQPVGRHFECSMTRLRHTQKTPQTTPPHDPRHPPDIPPIPISNPHNAPQTLLTTSIGLRRLIPGSCNQPHHSSSLHHPMTACEHRPLTQLPHPEPPLLRASLLVASSNDVE